MQLQIEENLELRLMEEAFAPALFALTDKNRKLLRQWLPWLDMTNKESDTLQFIKSAMAQYTSGNGPLFAIFHLNHLVGVIGFHSINKMHHLGEIGYWLSEDANGNGIMTKATSAVIETGFSQFGLNRIKISCATENLKSRAIPERLDFKLEAILRQEECLYGHYVDHAIYGLLKSEFEANQFRSSPVSSS